ncbi:hypothetical protein HPB48_011456 [Haemaphysalis longicornis]|uniref:Uncharacterized protein n=1 Tax=Haemaphysalis longicornis TaxID=44386 RepID=A0A9J6FBK0_HAELO|nr:hypothetical protein HPB48_011456 [Haemaphysalis longicornis]
MLRPGEYTLLASAAGYLPAAARFTVTDGQRWGPPVVLTLHFAPRVLPVLQMPPPAVLSRTKNGTGPGNRSPPRQPSRAGLPSSSTAPDGALCSPRILLPSWALLVGIATFSCE